MGWNQRFLPCGSSLQGGHLILVEGWKTVWGHGANSNAIFFAWTPWSVQNFFSEFFTIEQKCHVLVPALESHQPVTLEVTCPLWASHISTFYCRQGIITLIFTQHLFIFYNFCRLWGGWGISLSVRRGYTLGNCWLIVTTLPLANILTTSSLLLSYQTYFMASCAFSDCRPYPKVLPFPTFMFS